MTMLRLLLFLAGLALVFAPAANAQDIAVPVVEVELSEPEVIPGQPVSLRITVLVPTWMPKPVVFPTFEAPDLMVKLMERATNPTSRAIDGDTWSGVTRTYRLSPMATGPVQVPAQELTVFWAEPGETEPYTAQISVDPMTIVGVVPEGAEDLDPFVAASALTLTETFSSEARTLRPGDSLTRTITAEVSGTSPLFLPSLLPAHQIPGIASYPGEPEVIETSDRTWLSGTRVEQTVLVAESGGSGAVPPITLRWYNLDSGQIETAEIPGFEVTVDGPVARDTPEVDARLIALTALVAALGLFAAVRVGRNLAPRLRAWLTKRREVYEASETWAYHQLRRAIARQSYPDFLKALERWRARLPHATAHATRDLHAATTQLGACLYGTGQTEPAAAWAKVSDAVIELRTTSRKAAAHAKNTPGLVPLNPGSARDLT